MWEKSGYSAQSSNPATSTACYKQEKAVRFAEDCCSGKLSPGTSKGQPAECGKGPESMKSSKKGKGKGKRAVSQAEVMELENTGGTSDLLIQAELAETLFDIVQSAIYDGADAAVCAQDANILKTQCVNNLKMFHLDFNKMLLRVCRTEFDNITQRVHMSSASPADEYVGLRADCLRCFTFLGHLYLKSLLSSRTLSIIMHQLVVDGQNEHLPNPLIIECTCELLRTISHKLSLEAAQHNRIRAVCRRLWELQGESGEDEKYAYTSRVRSSIHGLVSTPIREWFRPDESAGVERVHTDILGGSKQWAALSDQEKPS